MAEKLRSDLSLHMVMRLNSLSFPKKFSMRCRHLVDVGVGVARAGAARVLGNDDLMSPLAVRTTTVSRWCFDPRRQPHGDLGQRGHGRRAVDEHGSLDTVDDALAAKASGLRRA